MIPISMPEILMVDGDILIGGMGGMDMDIMVPHGAIGHDTLLTMVPRGSRIGRGGVRSRGGRYGRYGIDQQYDIAVGQRNAVAESG